MVINWTRHRCESFNSSAVALRDLDRRGFREFPEMGAYKFIAI